MISTMEYNTTTGSALVAQLLSRSQLDYGTVQEVVDQIISEVKHKKNEALFDYTEKFDGFRLTKESIQVTPAEVEAAYKKVDPSLIAIIQKSIGRIRNFHEKQKLNSWMEPSTNGEILGQMIRPIEKVGVYVPGGTAFYPSSVLMNVIPAQVAGVSQIVMVTPCNKNGEVNAATIVSAKEAGVQEIYKIGGAQAIAALAFGTESVPKVDKIVGPGNIYVALAKKSVYGYVNIDSVAGPSEILVIADHTANPEYVAADLLSQAEHDALASAILITDDAQLAQAVKEEIQKQVPNLSRKEIIEKSLRDYGAIIVVNNLAEAAELSNLIAPEHLELCTQAPFDLLTQIKNAGAVFLGHYSPEPLGDYMAGPNHVLPTSGTARFFSPLSVDDFIKKTSIISFTKEALKALAPDIIQFAEAEALTAHANAVRVRKYD